MTERDTDTYRRIALGTIAGSVLLPLTGCAELVDGGGGRSNAIRNLSVSELQLVVDLREDATVGELTVVSPSGEEFATRSVSPGVTRETFDLGMPYEPGEYEVYATTDGEAVGESALEIRPNPRITDLKLGRNHPDEMYEGASDQAIRSEVIVSVENKGTGPDAITALRFSGDVPQPTPEDFEESGIYDTSEELGGHQEQVYVSPEERTTLFSNSRPFSPTGSNVSCGGEAVEGEFTMTILSTIRDSPIRGGYNITYSEGSQSECDISLSSS
ncbi:hypothetical protein [Halorarum salinum]|uniref:Uncharacterized protein n=1 Tax=Halorarum salinum TaxID=2743089 RepID=A0A7D5L874_9EURY|nr:hypothetical protein [Halobaculum salinum]QLG60274.1 hypothetical protein HUG12_00235 [Halobaculum salinum]